MTIFWILLRLSIGKHFFFSVAPHSDVCLHVARQDNGVKDIKRILLGKKKKKRMI